MAIIMHIQTTRTNFYYIAGAAYVTYQDLCRTGRIRVAKTTNVQPFTINFAFKCINFAPMNNIFVVNL